MRAPRIYPDNPHVRICGGLGPATTLVYPTVASELRAGPQTYAQLAEDLDAKVDSIIKATTRKTKTFTKVAGDDGVTRLALVERRVS